MKYNTPIGLHDGDSWEKLCQVCLKVKYDGDYLPVPASPGDYGLDGYRITGEVYQCYCPERECSDKELYASQRKKITDDVKKLKLYCKDIKRLLGDIKITRWFFLTPKYTDNKLIVHCNNKAEEVRSWGLEIIDDDFKVIPLDYEYMSKELPTALAMLDYTSLSHGIERKLNIKAETIDSREIQSYKEDLENSDYTKHAYRKHKRRLELLVGDDENRIIRNVDRTVEHLLVGDKILKGWETTLQDQYEKFDEVIKSLEKDIEDTCSVPTSNPEERYKEIKDKVYAYIDSEFSYLSTSMRDHLARRVIADWILRCPLDFE